MCIRDRNTTSPCSLYLIRRVPTAMQAGRSTTKREAGEPSRPIPVLMTVRQLHHGGIEHDVTKLAIHLDRLAFEPHVASYQAEGMRFDELRSAGVPVLSLPL